MMKMDHAIITGALALVTFTLGHAAGINYSQRHHDDAVLSGTVVIQAGPLEAVFDCREITGT